MTFKPGKLSLKAEYLFPGHSKGLGSDIVRMPLMDLHIQDFFDTVIPLGNASDYPLNINTGYDITEKVVNKIIEYNND